MIDIPELPALAPAGADRMRALAETILLDFSHPRVAALVQGRGWQQLTEHGRIAAAYAFVRDEIAFGYNRDDDLKASEVLADGYGQCNTKSTLMMALLRALGIPCRFHGFTIDKQLQRGAITGLAYWLAPRNIIHSWARSGQVNAGPGWKASSWTSPTWGRCNCASPGTAAHSAATARPRQTCNVHQSTGTAVTPSFRRMASTRTSACLTAPTSSTPAMVST